MGHAFPEALYKLENGVLSLAPAHEGVSFLATWGYSPRAGLLVEGELLGEHLFSEVKVSYSWPQGRIRPSIYF